MKKEFKVMVKVNGKWYTAHETRYLKTCERYDDAVRNMEWIVESRLKSGHPAEGYKIVCREVTDWKDV